MPNINFKRSKGCKSMNPWSLHL